MVVMQNDWIQLCSNHWTRNIMHIETPLTKIHWYLFDSKSCYTYVPNHHLSDHQCTRETRNISILLKQTRVIALALTVSMTHCSFSLFHTPLASLFPLFLFLSLLIMYISFRTLQTKYCVFFKPEIHIKYIWWYEIHMMMSWLIYVKILKNAMFKYIN